MAQVQHPKETPARRAAVKIARRLRQEGHEAYLAGGCVRDELLGLVPADYDVATDARPPRVRELFPNSKYVGEAFGVVLVRLNRTEVEVATFRTEWGYTDGRRPTEIHFSDAQHDAQRRDFTINGLFEDPDTGDIIDHVGGLTDLQQRLIRAIGDPAQRFDEDYLRMLRAVRFAARLDFALDPATAEAIVQHADKLRLISRERIGQEVQWMLTADRPAQAAALMQQLQLDAPTLMEPHREATLPILTALPARPAYACALAAWMLDRHASGHQPGPLPKAEGARILRGWRRALCLSNEVRDAVAATVAHAHEAMAWPDATVAQRKRLLAQPHWPLAWTLLEAMGKVLPAMDDLTRRIERDSQPLRQEGVAPTPLVSGDDLIAQGRTPGPTFRRILDAVYDEQLEGRVCTRDEALNWIRQWRVDNG